MKRFLQQIACLALFMGIQSGLWAEEVWHEEDGWGLNLPETWVLMDASTGAGNVNFSDPAGHAFLQVFKVTGSAKSYAAGVLGSMKAKPVGDANQTFSFNQGPSLWTEARWLVGTIPVHGYFLAIDALSASAADPFVLIAYSLEADWANYRDALQSLLDSFFIGESTMYLPGPVTQLAAQVETQANGRADAQAVAVKVSQAVAARESRILAGYQDSDAAIQDRAWRRFYQLIWKDSYSRLDLVAKQIAQVFSEERVPRERQPVELLSFVQDFTAETYSDLSDIRVPVDAINRQAGDCDGRGLVFMILLEHLGFSSILLVSSAYSHSMVGLDHQAAGIKDGGFTFPLDGKNWMVAETMAKVKLGQINNDMSDPAKWLGFDLHFVP